MALTWFWMGLFFFFGVVFWGVSVWAMIFGGRDLIEIITTENAKIKARTQPQVKARPAPGVE